MHFTKKAIASLLIVSMVAMVTGCKESKKQANLDLFDQLSEVTTFKNTGTIKLSFSGKQGSNVPTDTSEGKTFSGTTIKTDAVADIAENGVYASKLNVASPSTIESTSESDATASSLDCSGLVIADSRVYIPVSTIVCIQEAISGQEVSDEAVKQTVGEAKYFKIDMQSAESLATSTTGVSVTGISDISNENVSKLKEVYKTSVLPIFKDKLSTLKDKIIKTSGNVSTLTLTKDTAQEVVDKLIEMQGDGTFHKMKSDIKNALGKTSTSTSTSDDTAVSTSSETDYSKVLNNLKQEIANANKFDISLTSTLSNGSSDTASQSTSGSAEAPRTITYEIKIAIELGAQDKDNEESVPAVTDMTISLSFTEGNPEVKVPADTEVFDAMQMLNGLSGGEITSTENEICGTDTAKFKYNVIAEQGSGDNKVSSSVNDDEDIVSFDIDE